MKIQIFLATFLAFFNLQDVQGRGYIMLGEPIQISNGLRVHLQKSGNDSAFHGEAEQLTLDAYFEADYRLRLKIYDDQPRFEVPLQIRPPATSQLAQSLYSLQFQNNPLFSFRVVRNATGTVLFESDATRGFIFADQFITLSWKPASTNVYGIGENEQKSFRHNFSENLTWGLWSRDQPPDFKTNMYGVHPHYTTVETDGNSHAVAIVNSNAQQFSMLSGPLIEYITTGGLLDLYFFLGPTPEDTVLQYTEAVGPPQLPPYWSLGFQLCRIGYSTIDRMQLAVNRTAMFGIPQDVQYGDIDIMERNLDFTFSPVNFPGLPEYVRELKEKGIKFITIQDPFISSGEPNYRPLQLGQEMDVWVKRADGQSVLGRVWPEHPVYFPDYSKNTTHEWWSTLIREFHEIIEFDGLWIDMNEPANMVEGDVNTGCEQNQWNRPPFVPQIGDESLTAKTLCGDHVQEAGRHYDVHSLYGWFESEPTLQAVRAATGKRGLVLSRSTFLGSGHWIAHWLGDNFSLWSNLHTSIIGMLQFNLFGINLVGADICGFIGDATAELCQRWMQLGAFYPFSRNHNAGSIDQDPGYWGPEVAESSRNVLLVRYTLLPYLYTLFAEGGTVARALWHEFPRDPETWAVDKQFLWGSGLLISPALEEGQTEVQGYLPGARWYNYFTGEEEPRPRNYGEGSWVAWNTPLDSINLHVRGGVIIPTQEPAVNTQISRNNPFGLIVALDEENKAKGKLFYDDGESIGTKENGNYFLAEATLLENGTMEWTVQSNGYAEMREKVLDTIRVLGAASKIEQVHINGQVHENFENLPGGEVLIRQLGINITTSFKITWI